MERLTPEQIADMKEYFSRSKEVKASSLAIKLSHDGLKLIDIIEAQQQENNGWRERYDELDAGHSRLFKDFCKLQQENEQLRARVARMREALRKAREALEQTKGFIKGIGCYCNCEGEYASQCQPCFIVEQIDKALAVTDKAIGGKEDV